MKLPARFLSLLTASAFLSAPLHAEEVTTDPVGVIKLEVLPGSDAALSAPLHRSPDFSGVVSEIDDSSTLTVQGTPEWDADSFASSHYLFVNDGEMEGAYAVVSSNTADSVSLTFVSEDLNLGEDGGLSAGDRVSLIPFWTLGSLYPEESVPDGTEILLFDRSVKGVDVSAAQIFTFYEGFGWYLGSTSGEGHPIYPDESYILRAPSAESIQTALTGTVNVSDFRLVLELVEGGATQDIRLTSSLPVPVELGNLFGEGEAADGDEVLLFDNSISGVDKSASLIATYYEGFGWYLGSTPLNDHLVNPGEGIVYRRSGSNSATSVAKVDSPLSTSE